MPGGDGRGVPWHPQDPVRLERFRQFDGIGLLTGFPAICALVIGLLQGERLDWFSRR